MLKSNKTINHFIKIVIPLLLILSCSKNDIERASDAQTATFFVEKIEGSSNINKIDPVYSLPKSRLYNFKICVKDILQAKAIAGQAFNVTDGNSLNKNMSSDDQGCLNWSESIDFNFIAPSTYIEISRRIAARGIHKGVFNIKLVLNPWSHGENTSGVIDPSKEDISSFITEDKSVSALKSENTTSPLWVIDPKVMIMQKDFTSSGANMLLRFQSKIALALKNTADQNVQYQINTGNFDVEMILYNAVNENGKEKLIQLGSGIKTNATFNQELLIAEFPFNLNVLPTQGQILMAVKVSAPNNLLGLEPFNGVFLVSNDFNLKIEKTVSLIPDSTFETIKEKVSVTNETKTNVQNPTKPGIEIDKLEVKFFKLGTENTTTRQVFFNVKACLKNNIGHDPVRNVDLQVKTISNNTPVTLTTSQEGCISWDDSIWHKFFGSEHFVKKSVSISNKTLNLDSKIDIILNPWDTGFNFGRDGRFVDDLGSLAINPSNENAKIVFDNYNFAVQGYNYEINKNLDLYMIKNGTLTLSARVARHSSLSEGRMGNEMLRDGKYLLKWAFVSLENNQKIDSIISMGQKVVNTLGGDIKTDIGVRISAFEKLNQRSRLIVALYTIKENKNATAPVVVETNSGLDATPYIATIVLNNDSDGQKLSLLENSEIKISGKDVFETLASMNSNINQAKDLDLVRSNSTANILASENLKKITLNNANESLLLKDGLANPTKFLTKTEKPEYYREQDQKPALANVVLEQFVKSGKLSKDLALKFCNFWFYDHFRRYKNENKINPLAGDYYASLVQSCTTSVQSNPEQFFAINKKLIVKKLGNTKYKRGTTTNLNVGNTFSLSKADASSTSKANAVSASAGLSFEPIPKILKLGTTYSYTLSSADTKSSTTNNYVQVSASTTLMLQTNSFDLTLESYEECTSIKLNPRLFLGKKAVYGNLWNTQLKPSEAVKLATSGYFICTGLNNTTPIVKEENYYLISQVNTWNHGQQDGADMLNQSLFMTFRGRNDLNSFMKFIQGSLKSPDGANTFEFGSKSANDTLSDDFATKIPTWSGAYSEL